MSRFQKPNYVYEKMWLKSGKKCKAGLVMGIPVNVTLTHNIYLSTVMVRSESSLVRSQMGILQTSKFYSGSKKGDFFSNFFGNLNLSDICVTY
jgi:hypothetical protein